MSKYHKLTASQKEEVRRLTQLANRRIKAAHKAYAKAGKQVAPREVVGHLQIKEDWATKSTPLSRSVKFESEKDYKKHLQFLRSFDPKATRAARPSITEYNVIQRTKTLQAVETSLGMDVPEDLAKKLNKMNAAELGTFWKSFSDKASRLGLKYSSEAAMLASMREIFPEDIAALAKAM